MESEYSGSTIKNGERVPSKIGPLIASTLIALITLAVFARALTADFLYWDDNWLLFGNAKLGISNLQHLWSILTDKTVSSSFYTPLTGLRWFMIYTFWGLNSFVYHLGSLLFHIANAILLFCFVRKLAIISLENNHNSETPQLRIDVAAALTVSLWSIHPLMVEPVAAISCGGHVQAVFFILLSLLFYLRMTETRSRYISWLMMSAVCYGASLLSLPFILAYPAILIVMDVYPLKRIKTNTENWWKSPETHHIITEKIPFVVIDITVIAINMFSIINVVKAGHSYVFSLAIFGMLDRVMQAFYIWAYYVWRPWYPINLSNTYDTLISFDPLSFYFVISALGVMGATVVFLLIRKRNPSILASWICYLAILVPALGLAEHPHNPADRYAMYALIIWSVLLTSWIVNVRIAFFRLLVPVVISILIVLGIMSAKHVNVWHNTETMSQNILKLTKNDTQRMWAYRMLGEYYWNKGQIEKSESFIRKCLDIDKDEPFCNKSLERIFMRECHNINKDDPFCNYNLGKIMEQTGRTDEAFKYYEKALNVKPDFVEAHIKLGTLFFNHNKREEAKGYFKKAIQINPNSSEAHFYMALLLLAQRKNEESLQEFYQTVRIDHNHVLANYYLGVITAAQGRYDEAIQHFQDTLRIRPDFEEAQKDLRNVLTRKERMPRALD
jgi:cytochrome c-type biogenesis protein CcmH/NrfG